MTIKHSESLILKELNLRGGYSSIETLETLKPESFKALINKELIAIFDDKVILTDVGLEVAGRMK